MQSISAPEITTAFTGEFRGGPFAQGCKRAASRNCAGKSGLAFKSTQKLPSALTAKDAWLRGFTAGSPERARRQLRRLKFHCGNPPAAAAPSTLISMRNLPMAAGRGPLNYLPRAEI